MSDMIFAYIDVTPLENLQLFKECYSLLSNQRKKKVDNLRFQNDKNLSVCAELLLKYCLSEFFGIENPKFKLNSYGKIYLDSEEKVFFNLSHSGNFTALSIGNYENGCDIEKVKKIDLKIAKRFFTSNEYQSIILKEKSEQIDLFYRYWTLKESFLKTLGKGFSLSPESFEFSIFNEQISLAQSFDNSKYYFKEINALSGYKCSVCQKENAFNLKVKKITMDMIKK